jgi:hypothetical protein
MFFTPNSTVETPAEAQKLSSAPNAIPARASSSAPRSTSRSTLRGDAPSA